MRPLAGREDRCGTGAFVPVAECGLRDGVDNIGELSISRMANIPLRRMRILTSLRLQAKVDQQLAVELPMTKQRKTAKSQSFKLTKLPKQLQHINLNAAGIDIGSERHQWRCRRGAMKFLRCASLAPSLLTLKRWALG